MSSPESLNSDLDSLKEWLEGNKLSLNVIKTQVVVIGPRPHIKKISDKSAPTPSFAIGDSHIDVADNANYLGVQLDKHLVWDEHTKALRSEISRSLSFLKYGKKLLPKHTLIPYSHWLKLNQVIECFVLIGQSNMLNAFDRFQIGPGLGKAGLTVSCECGISQMYRGIVEPHFRYCCSVWGSCGDTYLLMLQKLQNRAARIVTNSSYDAPAANLIKELNWPTVRDMIKQETIYI